MTAAGRSDGPTAEGIKSGGGGAARRERKDERREGRGRGRRREGRINSLSLSVGRIKELARNGEQMGTDDYITGRLRKSALKLGEFAEELVLCMIVEGFRPDSPDLHQLLIAVERDEDD